MAALGGGCRFEKSSDIAGVAAQLQLLSYSYFARERCEEETAGKEKRAPVDVGERERERKTGGGTRRRATKEGEGERKGEVKGRL